MARSNSRQIVFEMAAKVNSKFYRGMKDTTKSFQDMSKHAEKLNQQMKFLEKQGKLTDKQAAKQRKLNAEYGKTLKVLSRTSKMSAAGHAIKGDLSAKSVVTKGAMQAAPLLGAGAAAMNDEANLSDVRKVFQLSAKATQEFRTELVGATRDIPMTNKEIYDMAAAAGMAGIAQGEVAEFTRDAAVMSKAFNMEAGDTGDIMAKWREAFKMSRDDVLKLGDQINYLGNTVAAQPAEITKTVMAIGTLGSTAGFSEAQTAALSAALLGQGNQADVTKTALKNMYLTMSAGESATDRQAEAYKKLGFSASEMAKAVQKDSKKALLDLFGAIDKLDDHEKAAVMSDLFGKESIGVLADLANNTELAGKLMTDMGASTRYAGSMLNEYNNKTDNAKNKAFLMKKELGEVVTKLGYGLLPVLNQLSPVVIEMAQRFSEWATANPEMVGTIMKVAAGLVAANTAVGLFRVGIGNLLIAGSRLVPFFSSVAAFVAANPFALLAAGAVAAGVLIYKNWDKIKEYFQNFADWFVNLGKKIITNHPLFKAGKWIGDKLGIGGDKKEIPAYARGGVVTSPQMALVGEGGSPETIIPHNNSARSRSLWEATGRAIGATTGGGTSISIHYSPNFYGADPKADVENDLTDLVERAMEEIQRRSARLSF